jgi:hypothetical protein
MNIIKKLGIKRIQSVHGKSHGGEYSFCFETNVRELERQRDKMLEALIDIMKIMEPARRDFTGAWVYKWMPTIEKATGKTWNEIKELYENKT